MSDVDSPRSQFSIEDDEIVWTQSALGDTDFIVLRHPLRDACSLPSTLSDITSTLSDVTPGSDGDLSSALDKLSLSGKDSFADSSSTSAESISSDDQSYDNLERGRAAKPRLSSITLASYDDASAFISRYILSPVKGGDAELTLLRALLIELGLRAPGALDLPSTLTSARKALKAEAHVNIKEYVTTRHKGQSALREVLKPSKKAVCKEIRKGNKVSLRWVKQRGLQVLLVTCYRKS